MTEHEPFASDLPLYLTGDLPRQETARLEEHLAVCADCRRSLADTRAVLDLLRTSAGEASANELDGFYDARIAPLLRRRGVVRLLRAAALVLAFLAGVAVDRLTDAATEQIPESSAPFTAAEKEIYRHYLGGDGGNLTRTLIALAHKRR